MQPSYKFCTQTVSLAPYTYRYQDTLDLIRRVEEASKAARSSVLFFGEKYVDEMFGHNEQSPVHPI